MAKKIGKLAGRYARALRTAVERELGTGGMPSPAQKAAEELSAFAEIYEREHGLSSALVNPMFEKGERMNALLQIARQAGLQDILVRFLQVCFDRDRITLLPEIAAAFREAANAAAGIVQVEVVTARNVSQEEKNSIEQGLVRQIKGNLQFSWKVEASILGGMVVRYAGKVLDGSLGGRLARIESRLQTAS